MKVVVTVYGLWDEVGKLAEADKTLKSGAIAITGKQSRLYGFRVPSGLARLLQW